MTRKDYQLIAEVFRAAREHDTPAIVAEKMAEALKADNPRFDRARFLRACGVSP